EAPRARDAGAADASREVKLARLKVIVGRTYGTGMFVDGRRRDFDGYAGVVELTPGRHELVVQTMLGPSAPKIVDVADDGSMFAVGPGGVRAPISAEGLRVDVETPDAGP
ncbi:hypothetical protein L6R52_34230, partial [Myxococcota bacterium]|nr:hypothetical protein [Myxococcota bacterium]